MSLCTTFDFNCDIAKRKNGRLEASVCQASRQRGARRACEWHAAAGVFGQRLWTLHPSVAWVRRFRRPTLCALPSFLLLRFVTITWCHCTLVPAGRNAGGRRRRSPLRERACFCRQHLSTSFNRVWRGGRAQPSGQAQGPDVAPCAGYQVSAPSTSRHPAALACCCPLSAASSSPGSHPCRHALESHCVQSGPSHSVL